MSILGRIVDSVSQRAGNKKYQDEIDKWNEMNWKRMQKEAESHKSNHISEMTQEEADRLQQKWDDEEKKREAMFLNRQRKKGIKQLKQSHRSIANHNLKDATTIGGVAGLGLGAGIGHLVGRHIGKKKAEKATTEEEKKKIMRRAKIAGTLVGAGIGTVGGALAGRGFGHLYNKKKIPQQYKSMRNEYFSKSDPTWQ